MRAGVVGMLVIVLLAGCIAADEPRQPDPDAQQAIESHPFGARGCEASVLMFLVPFEQTAAWLPPGYNPRDIQGFLDFPVAAGHAGVMLAAMTCPSSQFDAGGVEMAFAAIFVEPPGIGQGLEPATYHFYEVAHFLPDGPLLRTLAGWEWRHTAATVEVSRLVPQGPQSVFAIVEDAQGILFQFVTGTPVQVPFEDVLLRVWHQAPTGTGRFEYRFTQNILIGPAACTVRPGSVPAEMVADFSCPPARAVAASFPGLDFEGVLEFWPGVYP